MSNQPATGDVIVDGDQPPSENKPVGENQNELEGVRQHTKNVGAFDIWALGITIVIGGQYFCWNAGLQAGFGSYVIATFLIGTAYISLVMSMAEVTSVLPFAGGAYGFARLALGLYPGFLIGICEAVEYMVYVATATYSLCLMVAGMTGSSAELVPVYCLVFYLSALALHLVGGRTFWRANAAMAVVSLLIVLVYGLGGLKYANLARYGPSPLTTGQSEGESGWFLGGMMAFMKVMPLSTWFYVGVESLNLANGYPSEVR
jgi:amino acid transporter